jgi:hypothetical protein
MIRAVSWLSRFKTRRTLKNSPVTFVPVTFKKEISQ